MELCNQVHHLNVVVCCCYGLLFVALNQIWYSTTHRHLLRSNKTLMIGRLELSILFLFLDSICWFPCVCIYNFRYSVTYGMFHFCVLDSELDWRAGSEQHKWLESCLASVDRRSQPWLIVTGHRVLGYSSADEYAAQGTFGEPMAREALEHVFQQYKVDIAIFGHVHQYERTCPVYEVPNFKMWPSLHSGFACDVKQTKPMGLVPIPRVSENLRKVTPVFSMLKSPPYTKVGAKLA